jgi:hypothetical protein
MPMITRKFPPSFRRVHPPVDMGTLKNLRLALRRVVIRAFGGRRQAEALPMSTDDRVWLDDLGQHNDKNAMG